MLIVLTVLKILVVVSVAGSLWSILLKRNITKVGGVSFTLSSYEKGLWFDHDSKEFNPKGWGIKINLNWGKMIRPIKKFWIPGNNPWKGDKPWFVIRIPFMVGIFVSVALGKYGVYLGTKTFRVSEKHRSFDRYALWMPPDEFGTDENPATYLQLSVSIRDRGWLNWEDRPEEN